MTRLQGSLLQKPLSFVARMRALNALSVIGLYHDVFANLCKGKDTFEPTKFFHCMLDCKEQAVQECAATKGLGVFWPKKLTEPPVYYESNAISTCCHALYVYTPLQEHEIDFLKRYVGNPMKNHFPEESDSTLCCEAVPFLSDHARREMLNYIAAKRLLIATTQKSLTLQIRGENTRDYSALKQETQNLVVFLEQSVQAYKPHIKNLESKHIVKKH